MIQGAISQGAGTILGIGLGGIQRRQQKKLQDQQIEGAKELKDYEAQTQMDIWNKTNYEAQMKHMQKAGLNPALMYGQGGGAGGTTGSGGMAMPTEAVAEAPSATAATGMGMAIMKAQKEVLESQAEKNKADAEKTRGVDTEESTTRTGESAERTRGNKFDNDIKEMVGVLEHANTKGAELQASSATSRRERQVSDSWTAVMNSNEKGETRSGSEEDSRLYQSLLNEYREAKANLNLKKAEEVIKSWSTELIKDGMPPDSPWYYKLIERFINNASGGKINLKNLGKEVGKQIIK